MARLQNNPLMKGASGRIGKTLVVKTLVDGSQVLANTPAKRKKHSAKQVEHLDRFKDAKWFANIWLVKHPEIKAMYQQRAKGTIRNWHNLAIGDHMNPPEIHEIHIERYTGEPGEIIRVRATDDFKVASVKVTITAADGRKIETGEAQPRGKKGLWRFFTTVKNQEPQGTVITAMAFDLARNDVTATLTCSDIVGEQIWRLKAPKKREGEVPNNSLPSQ
ncbi:hypothetical protein WBG78_14605 [Chryseolinea sp. T2]|uniref:hypothetical protein n=1 Tax=Chryseolinea sp. T2 TaxID=3129255 RepID=UPI003077B238